MLTVYRANRSSHPRVKIRDVEALMQADVTRLRDRTDFETLYAEVCARWDATHPRQTRQTRISQHATVQ